MPVESGCVYINIVYILKEGPFVNRLGTIFRIAESQEDMGEAFVIGV